MENKEQGLRPAFIFGLCGALLCGMLLGAVLIPWMAGRLMEARAASSSVLGNLVDVADMKDADGRFMILDYPAEAAGSYVELGDLNSISVAAVEMPEITDEDIDGNIRSWLLYYGKEIDLGEGTCALGDRVYLKYEASVDGEPLDGYASDGAVIELFEGNGPDGFDRSVAGMSVGESKTFTVDFPEDWPDPDVAGMTGVTFEVELLSIRQLPELTDDNMSGITDGQFDTVDAFREFIRESLASVDEEMYRDTVYGEALEALTAASVFRSVPKDLLTWYASVQMYYYQMAADEMEVTIEAYLESMGLGDNPSKVANAIAESGTEPIRRYALLTAVADRVGITVDADDTVDTAAVQERLYELAAGLGIANTDELSGIYKESNLTNDVRNQKTIDWLVENIRQEPVENVVETVD